MFVNTGSGLLGCAPALRPIHNAAPGKLYNIDGSYHQAARIKNVENIFTF